MQIMWKVGFTALSVAAVCACGPAPDRDATQNNVGTSGARTDEIAVTGCLALGQMGIYMLTAENDLPTEGGLGRGAATRGYQLLGQPDDFNQYMNKRVRVVGTRSDMARERPDSDRAPAAHDTDQNAPWPKLQVREVDPVGGECKTQ
jgi:hypothetical protein